MIKDSRKGQRISSRKNIPWTPWTPLTPHKIETQAERPDYLREGVGRLRARESGVEEGRPGAPGRKNNQTLQRSRWTLAGEDRTPTAAWGWGLPPPRAVDGQPHAEQLVVVVEPEGPPTPAPSPAQVVRSAPPADEVPNPVARLLRRRVAAAAAPDAAPAAPPAAGGEARAAPPAPAAAPAPPRAWPPAAAAADDPEPGDVQPVHRQPVQPLLRRQAVGRGVLQVVDRISRPPRAPMPQTTAPPSRSRLPL